MQHECKITVIDKKCFTDYQEQYLADPKSGPCPFFNVGDEFVLKRTPQQDDFYHLMDGKFCGEAWDAVSRYVYSALQGGSIMKENSKQLQRQVFIYNRIKADNDAIYSNVDAIQEAIQNNRQIGFKYCEWTVRKELVQKKNGAEYIVSPWALTWDDENYYMVGYEEASGKIKHYRVDKMQEICVTEAGRLGRENFKDFDLAAFARKTFGMYGGEDRKITLEGENHLVGVVIDRFGTDVMIHPHDQEHFHAGVTITVSPQFFGWLAGIGKGIRISWPEDVREAYKQYLQGIVDSL